LVERFDVEEIKSANNDVLTLCYDAPRCLVSQASGKEVEEKACAQGAWIHFKAYGHRGTAPTITTKHRGPSPKEAPGAPPCSSAKEHTMFPQAVGVIQKCHPQQNHTNVKLNGTAPKPLEYVTVQ
jgi:hypothetical protein